MLRSIRRRGGPRRPPLLSDGADRGDREGVAATEVAVRGRLEPFFRLNLVLYEGRGDLFTVTGASTVEGHGRLRPTGRARRGGPSVRRDAEAARLRGAEPGAYNLLCSYLGLLDADPAARAPRGGARFRFKLAPPPAPSSRAARAAARRSTWRRSRGRPAAWSARAARGRLPAQRGDAPVHGRGAGAPPLRGAPVAERPVAAQADRAITETLEHHAHVRLRAAA